jgi:thioredoxin-like negative regulator of GroEL
MASLVGLYGEPLATTALSAADLVGMARTLFRAGAKGQAILAVERAMERGAGKSALLARAEMHKRMGDRERALADFEALSTRGDDPRACLELAKLYEHFAKDPVRALATSLSGTGESPLAASRRRRRLERKIARAKM